MSPGRGLRSLSFLAAKSWSSRDGTPALTVHSLLTIWLKAFGRPSVFGIMSNTSQFVSLRSSGSTEIIVGVMIQRTTRPIVSGVIADFDRAPMNWERGTFKERRWTVQIGMVRDDAVYKNGTQ